MLMQVPRNFSINLTRCWLLKRHTQKKKCNCHKYWNKIILLAANLSFIILCFCVSFFYYYFHRQQCEREEKKLWIKYGGKQLQIAIQFEMLHIITIFGMHKTNFPSTNTRIWFNNIPRVSCHLLKELPAQMCVTHMKWERYLLCGADALRNFNIPFNEFFLQLFA
jgi:hypothetical protein